MLSRETPTWIDELDAPVPGRRVFVRADLNVPLKGSTITDDERIRASLPTLEYLISKNARVVVASHLGRPKGRVKAKLSMAPIAERLQELLGCEILLADDCVGDAVSYLKRKLEPGQVLLLENTRFHSGETKNNPRFAADLAHHIDIYVNDAFGAAHRAHATTEGICHHVSLRCGGHLLRKECDALDKLLSAPRSGFCAIVGGAKVSDKIGALSALAKRANSVLIGGAMAYTFLKAKGERVGASLVEDDKISVAGQFLKACEASGVRVYLPSDHTVADTFAEDANFETLEADTFSPSEIGVDIGPRTRALYQEVIRDSKTILWNGPMGVFEWAASAHGTKAVMEAVADADAYSVVGGGDSVAALNLSGRRNSVSHVSTGGGASLEYIQGKTLPGIAALTRKEEHIGGDALRAESIEANRQENLHPFQDFETGGGRSGSNDPTPMDQVQVSGRLEHIQARLARIEQERIEEEDAYQRMRAEKRTAYLAANPEKAETAAIFDALEADKERAAKPDTGSSKKRIVARKAPAKKKTRRKKAARKTNDATS